jgi:hypothetical protein
MFDFMKLSFSQTNVSVCKAGMHKSCMTNFVWWHLIFLASFLQFFPLCTKMCIISHVLCRKNQIPERVTGHSRTVGLQFYPFFKSCFWHIIYTGSFHTFWKFVNPWSKGIMKFSEFGQLLTAFEYPTVNKVFVCVCEICAKMLILKAKLQKKLPIFLREKMSVC